MTNELKSKIETLVPTLEGWCWSDKAIQMADLILETKPSVVVELGVFGGRSLIPMALALREVGQGKIYGVDPWQVESAIEGEGGDQTNAHAQWWIKDCPLAVIHDGCMKTIWREKLEQQVVIMRARAEHVANLFAQPHAIDILHFDQNHSELSSVRDLNIYYPLVKPGGYIWFDDTHWTSTQKALNILSEQAIMVKDLVVEGVGACRLFRKETQHELDQKIIFQA